MKIVYYILDDHPQKATFAKNYTMNSHYNEDGELRKGVQIIDENRYNEMVSLQNEREANIVNEINGVANERSEEMISKRRDALKKVKGKEIAEGIMFEDIANALGVKLPKIS